MDEKQRLQSNIFSILAVGYMHNLFFVVVVRLIFVKGHTPSPEVGVVSEVLGVAQKSWEELWKSEKPRKITVRASSLAACGEKIPYHKISLTGEQLAFPLPTDINFS